MVGPLVPKNNILLPCGATTTKRIRWHFSY